MSADVSLWLLAKAAAPPVALIAVSLAWFSWIRRMKAIPATLFSLGTALLALMLLVVFALSSADRQALVESIVLMVGFVLLVYVATLVAVARRVDIAAPGAIVCGLAGLVPLYFASGFVLINAACSLGTGGC